MLWLSLQFLLGLALLLGGGDLLVRGAAAIARSLGVASVVIGMTVVAFGTSAPELVVALTGSATGAGAIAFGNVVGASIVNIALILGLTAVIHPLVVHPTIVTREIPMLGLAICAALILSLDQWLDAGPNRLARGDGLLLCLLFGVFLYYTVMALRRDRPDPFVREARHYGLVPRVKSLGLPLGLVVAGLAGLGLGGNLVVGAAVEIAARLGLDQATVGLTVVAVGTTLPELSTSLLAARRGEADLAIGNVVGSNIFNILLVLGLAAAVTPIDIPERGPLSLSIALAMSLLLLILIHRGGLNLNRREGIFLLLVFAAYLLLITFYDRLDLLPGAG